MTRDLGTLQREAYHAAALREHRLATFVSFSEHTALAACIYCGMEVMVRTRPMPNEIDIGGEAVALNCPKSEG